METQIILDHHKIPNAPFSVIPALERAVGFSKFTTALQSYPLFVKPVTEGSSKRIENFNKVNEPAELEMAMQKLRSKFPGQDILVESFLSGREFTVSILGTGSYGRVVGIREHIWQTPSSHSNKNGYRSNLSLDFASRTSKSSKGDKRLVYNDTLDMTDPQIKAACQVALDTWNVFNCQDSGRVDIRFCSHKPDSVPNVLEVSFITRTRLQTKIFIMKSCLWVNPIAGLLPGHSPLPATAKRNGFSFEELLTGIIESALRRKYQIDSH